MLHLLRIIHLSRRLKKFSLTRNREIMKEVVVYESYIYISKVYFVGEETIEIFQSGQLKSWG